MRLIILILLCVLGSFYVDAQEILAKVIVNTQKVNQTDNQVFKNLENALTEFINQTHWDMFSQNKNKMIPCQFVFTINDYDSGHFSAELHVQASRPVYNSMYSTSLLNVKDTDVEFTYQPFETIRYTPGVFDSNLSAIIAFYVNLILGLDADSFSLNAGEQYYNEAYKIVMLAQGNPYQGWSRENKMNRWQIAEDMVSPQLSDFHKEWYKYHRMGLDEMASYPIKGKESIAQSLIALGDLYSVRTSSALIQMFFDAKENEIVALFTAGSSVKNTEALKKALNKMSPSFFLQWNEIQ